MPRYPAPTCLPIPLDNGQLYLQSVVQDPAAAVSSRSCRGLAIIAHPFGRLGGSLNDPIVTHLAALLITHAQLRVVRFNSRGIGKSAGSPSWTGKSECQDFQDVVSRCIDNFCVDFPDSTGAQVVIAGYSAGALYASTVRVPPGVYDLKQFKGGHKPRYILLSFPAGVTWALSLFTTRTYTDALNKLLASRNVPGGAAEEDAEGDREAKGAAGMMESTPSNDAALQPVASHVLAIYGDQDQFTGIETYRKWIKDCSATAPPPSEAEQPEWRGRSTKSTFQEVPIEGADHFYRSSAALDGLDKAIIEWYDAISN